MNTDVCARLRARRAVRIAAALAASGGAAIATAVAADAASSLNVTVTHNVLVGQRVSVRGSDGSGQSGQTLAIQVRHGRGWATEARVSTGAGGAFKASWRPHATGRYLVRAVATGPGSIVGAPSSNSSTVTVYRTAAASWYGPGLYGSPVACGGTLEPGELGVANKTLPCGSRVTLRYHGRQVTVKVIDRGPYVAGRDYDLTDATRARLGFPDTGTLWASR
jgi:rare lipoprotein A